MVTITPKRRFLGLVTLIVWLIIIIFAILIPRLGLLPLDLSTTQALQSIQAGWFRYIMYIASIPGWFPWSMITVLIGSALAGWLWSMRIGIYFLVISTLQAPLNWLIKTVIARPRPSEPLVEVVKPESGYSFPSGHVMFYTIFFGFLLFMVLSFVSRRRRKTILLILMAGIILLVGISRIYLGAHWLSDVIAGYLVGLVYLGWAIEVYRSYLTRNDKLRDE
jgi:undecaprenyl-diphosphatase